MNANVREDLLAFVNRTEKLRRLSIFRGGLAATFEISGPVRGPLRASATEPEPEMVEALVSVLRPLILQSGGTSIGRVLNLCRLQLNDAELRRRLVEVRRLEARPEDWGTEARDRRRTLAPRGRR